MLRNSFFLIVIGVLTGCAKGPASSEYFRQTAIQHERSRIDAQNDADAKAKAAQSDDVNGQQDSKAE